MRGGKREGAGRPVGAKNIRTREVEAAMQVVAEKFHEALPDAFCGDGVAYLQTVYKDPRQPIEVRIDAAAKAARFERPALATTTLNATVATLPAIPLNSENLTPEQLEVFDAVLLSGQLGIPPALADRHG